MRASFSVVLMLLLVGTPGAFASLQTRDDAAQAERPLGPEPAQLEESVTRALEFLQRSQQEDGSYSPQAGPAVTALVVDAVLSTGRFNPDHPFVARSLHYLEGFIHEDGGIYAEGSNHRNYETCVTLLAFQAANEDGRYDETIARAADFLGELQWDEAEGHERSSMYYGGAGYGSHERPDLSNTQFLLDALEAADLPDDDPRVQRALVFVSRCQNFESEHNAAPFAALAEEEDVGGFYYTVAAGGQSQAGETGGGGLRSYGSMTYAGLKSMIYAGVGPDDPRVQAAFDWIREHYTVAENPYMGQQGVFYYYHTFAKALDAMELDLLEDADGTQHDWRRELAEELFRRQREDGSWVNDTERWYEGDPNLVTAYALLTLSYCRAPERE